MKISIDTLTDSKEHILKAIELLKHIVGEHAHTNAPSSAAIEPTQEMAGLMSIFDNTPAPIEPQAPQPITPTPHLQENKEKEQNEDDIPQIEFY